MTLWELNLGIIEGYFHGHIFPIWPLKNSPDYGKKGIVTWIFGQNFLKLAFNCLGS